MTIRSAFDIAGVLCLPEHVPAGEQLPAMLLIGGSGADTRDGDLVFPGPCVPEGRPAPGTLRHIAHHLAHHGIASVRCDRRGSGASGGDPDDSDYTTDLEDAKACMGWLRDRPEIDPSRVGVAGHSAGALTTCHVCRDIPDVAAAGLLGALASPVEDLLRWNLGRAQRHWEEFTPDQQATLIQEMPTELLRGEGVERLIEGARRGEEVVVLEGLGVSLTCLMARLRQDLRISYVEEFRHVSCPALVLHGGADLNVRVDDALVAFLALRRAGNTCVELAVLPGLDHYFIPVSPDPARRVMERLRLETMRRPMARQALGVIAAWAVRTLAPDRSSGVPGASFSV